MINKKLFLDLVEHYDLYLFAYIDRKVEFSEEKPIIKMEEKKNSMSERLIYERSKIEKSVEEKKIYLENNIQKEKEEFFKKRETLFISLLS